MLQSVTDNLATKPKGARLLTAVTTSAALSLSVLFHGSLPFLGALIREKKTATTIEMVVAPPPKLLATADKDKDGPVKDPEPEGEKQKSKKDAKSGQKDVKKPAPEKVAKAPPPPPPPAPKRVQPIKTAPPSKSRVRVRKSAEPTYVSRADRVRQMRADRAKRSKRKSGEAGGKGGSKGDDGKGGGEGGGAHAAGGGKKGKIDAVYACTKDGLGKKVRVRHERPIDDWVTIMPTVLMPFDTRPGLDDYLLGVTQIVSRMRKGIEKAGPVEFALPASVVQMGVEQPSGVRVALGHMDGRCLIGMRYSKQLFPIELMKVPVRVIDNNGNSAKALAHIKLYKDASFDIIAQEGSLPFKSGRLKNADGIASNIEQHYNAARAFRQVAGWFGVDVAKQARERRKERAKQRADARRDSRRSSSVAKRR
jgi:hypothetical protein